MVEVSIVIPAISHSHASDSTELASICAETFGVPSEMMDFYALVPLEEVRGSVIQVAVRLRPCMLTLTGIEQMCEQKDHVSEQLQRAQEALLTFSSQIDTLRHSTPKISPEKYQRRGLKLKQLDEDNKKLRQLLKTQLENSENLRVETQQTVETLRQEFDLLVKELMTFRKKEAQTMSSEAKGRRPKS